MNAPGPRLFRSARALAFTLASLAAAAALGLASAARADEVTYEIRKATTPAKAGDAATVSLTVVGKNGWHVNDEAPITAAVKADPGVTLPKAKLTRADLAESTKQSARFDIPFSAAEPGPKTITAQARFVMCQDQACKPATETVAFTVDVQAPGAPAPAAKGKPDKKVPAAKPAKPAAKPPAS